MRSRSGFTLVEILIVVVILGILAAIVVPQFTNASEEAKDSRLMQDLQSVRSQIELYKIQHSGAMPGTVTDVSFTEAMTGYTNAAGAGQTAPGTGVYGPYLQKMPSNPYVATGQATVTTATTTPTTASTTSGWFFNTVTGEFGAYDSVPHLSW